MRSRSTVLETSSTSPLQGQQLKPTPKKAQQQQQQQQPAVTSQQPSLLPPTVPTASPQLPQEHQQQQPATSQQPSMLAPTAPQPSAPTASPQLPPPQPFVAASHGFVPPRTLAAPSPRPQVQQQPQQPQQQSTLSTLNHVSRSVAQLHEGQTLAANTDRQVQRQLSEIVKSLTDASDAHRLDFLSLRNDYIPRAEYVCQNLTQLVVAIRF